GGSGGTVGGENVWGATGGVGGVPGGGGGGGDAPPYHHPVFVLTHHPHDPIEMAGGTTFYFVTDGIESALTQADAAAGGADIRLGGGAATIQEYMRAGLLDDLHVAVVPVLLGRGERLVEGLGDEGRRHEGAARGPAAPG